VLFVGGWDKEREEFLSQVASQVPLRIYGPDYWGKRTKPFSRARRCWQRTDLRLAHAARVIRESAVCLNLLRTQHIVDGKPDGLIMRHFEVPGSGGFLLSTRGGGATVLFPEGQTGEYFSSVAECIEKAKMYIADSS
jgi:spore maturation protein CgeB